MPASFRSVAVIGTGLIGGSFGLAFRKHFPESSVVGWDKPDVLRQALERGAIQEGIPELARAVAGADLIYVALPVGHTIELFTQAALTSWAAIPWRGRKFRGFTPRRRVCFAGRNMP
jgi:prephenate dehydrogenase